VPSNDDYTESLSDNADAESNEQSHADAAEINKTGADDELTKTVPGNDDESHIDEQRSVSNFVTHATCEYTPP
jgi:hypothetical protein